MTAHWQSCNYPRRSVLAARKSIRLHFGSQADWPVMDAQATGLNKLA